MPKPSIMSRKRFAVATCTCVLYSGKIIRSNPGYPRFAPLMQRAIFSQFSIISSWLSPAARSETRLKVLSIRKAGLVEIASPTLKLSNKRRELTDRNLVVDDSNTHGIRARRDTADRHG